MRNRSSFYNLFSRDRKTLYIVLSIVTLSVLTLTVVYAALSTTLNINGNAEVTAANWDIYLDNVQLNSNSATTNAPTITNKTTASFQTTLSKPGDFYEFTIDVVNNGSIDAMIDSVTKTPELSDTQKKYLNYIVEYQNGESIATKQLVAKKSFVRLKVKVEYRKDLIAADLPTTAETLNLSFKVNYTQSDDSNENTTIDNNGKLIKVVSGDYDTVGSDICIGEECFYVISSDEDSVTMFSKYNLYVGGVYNNGWTAYGAEATGIQNSKMRAWVLNEQEYNGCMPFSENAYWESESYPKYIYNENSNLYIPIENYKNYLVSLGVDIISARLIKREELEILECNLDGNCKISPYSWVYYTTYWIGTAVDDNCLMYIDSNGYFDNKHCSVTNLARGVRPVIKILKSQF